MEQLSNNASGNELVSKAHKSIKENDTPISERLFSLQNDEAVKDLLGIQPIQPPGSPNDVTMSFSSTPDWTNPWHLRGSAFDPAVRKTRDQRHDILFGESHFDPSKQRERIETDILPPKAATPPSSPKWPTFEAKTKGAAASPPTFPKWHTFEADISPRQQNVPPAFPLSQEEEDQKWMSFSEQDTTELTGPKALDDRQDTSISDDFASLERKSSDPRKQSNTTRVLAKHPTDAQAFDKYMDSVSLDDQALEALVEAKDDEKVAQRRGARGYRGRSNKRPEQPTTSSALLKKKKPTAHASKSKRGRPQRSLSSADVGMRKTRPLRANSLGVERRQYQRARGQTTLRDDLLCGMETQCRTDFTAEEERRLRSELVVEDDCVCGPFDDQTDSTQRPTGQKRGKKKQLVSSSRKVVCEFEGVLSPGSPHYLRMLKTDLAFQHAVKAGGLWQSLVGNHVRFPKEWWQGGYRAAPLGRPRKQADGNKWVYYDRHRIRGSKVLNSIVKRRDGPGQILLHLVVRDFMTSIPMMDIAIGCFHPNAKSVRVTEQPNKRLEDCRDVWMATRFRAKDMISVVDPTFLQEKIGQPKKSPLGDSKRKISNANVRAIFGESAPVRTAFVVEDSIYEVLASINVDDLQAHGPADILLKKYVFS